MQFDGTVDPDGNVYWSECRGVAFDCDVVSVTRDGAFRWRQRADRSTDGPLVVTSGLVVVGSVGAPCGGNFGIPVFGVLHGFRSSDGAPVWTRDLVAAAAGSWWPGVACVKGFPWPPTVQASRGALVVSLGVRDPSDFPGIAGTVTVDVHTGEVLDIEKQVGPSIQTGISGVLTAADGSLHFIVYPCAFAQVLHGTSAVAGERYSITEGLPEHVWARPVAVSDRYVFDVRNRRQADGEFAAILRWRRITDGTEAGSLVLGDVTGVVSVGDWAVVEGMVGRDTVLVGVDLSTATAKWVRAVTWSGPSASSYAMVGGAILTSSGSALYLEESKACSYDMDCGADAGALVEVAANGSEDFRGALPAGVLYHWGHAVDRGRWFVGGHEVGTGDEIVRAFDLPGRAPAEHGWVAPQGSMACDNAAR